MAKMLLIAAGLVAAGLFWNLQPEGPGQQAPPAVLATAQSPNEATSETATSINSTAAPAAPNTTSPAPAAQAQVAGELSGQAIAALGMTRQLAGDHLLTMEGRPHRILGSKEVADQAGQSETMLLIRDEVSGQVSYRRSGLQFTLKDGVDYKAFVSEHPGMRLLFVNPLYVQVAIDAAEIAGQYTALSKDDRVQKLRFLTRDPVVKAR